MARTRYFKAVRGQKAYGGKGGNMSYAEGSANCTHTPGIETHKESTPALWVRLSSSPLPICFALTNMPFFLSFFWFSAALNTRGRRVGDRRKGKVGRGQEERRRVAGVGGDSSDHQHNKSDRGLPQSGPFFLQCTLISFLPRRVQ